jgi:predicted transcriptional regulator
MVFDGREKVLRRSQTEMSADCLRAIREEGGKALPTHIMYRANLSWTVLRGYLRELEKTGLIGTGVVESGRFLGKDVRIHGPENVREGHRYYVLTEKGILWIQSFEALLQDLCTTNKAEGAF